MGIDFAPRIKIENVENPQERKEGIKLKTVDELIEKLKSEAKVI